MATTLQSLFACCCSPVDSDDESGSSEERPLLYNIPDVSILPKTMKRTKHTYGTKRSVVSSAAAAIFGGSSTKNLLSSSVLSSSLSTSSLVPTVAKPQPRERSALADITEAIGNICLGRSDEGIEESYEENYDESRVVTTGDEENYITPLISAYQVDCGKTLIAQSWKDICQAGSSVTKIAEASYAEVYRISNNTGTSIIKIMRLRSPDDEDSLELETAIKVSSVVSEIRIMNTLTELPGFVTFKDAHLIQGVAHKPFIDAYDTYLNNATEDSFFPDPRGYTKNSVFLAIELGDAGTVLDEYKLQTVEQVWDIFLSVTAALAKGEIMFQFEHRDLHENNICVAETRTPFNRADENPNLRFGFSNLNVSIIDYGLSRATLPSNETVSLDLEEDLSIFQGSDGHPQFNAYRKMRTHLFTQTRTFKPRAWHTPASCSQNNGHTWDEHIPYTNIIWISYLLSHLKKEFKKVSDGKDLKVFNEETRELSKRLDTRTKIENGAFMCATDILEYALEVGWVELAQTEVEEEEGGSGHEEEGL